MTTLFPFPRSGTADAGQGTHTSPPTPDPEASLFAHIAAVRTHLAEIGAPPDDPTLAMFEANARAMLVNAEASRLTRDALRDAKRADDAALAAAAEAGLARAVPGLRREIRAECAAIARGLSWGVAAAVGAVVLLASVATGAGVHLWDAAGQGRAVLEVRDALGAVFRDTSASGAAAVRLVEANAGVLDAEVARCQGGDVWADPSGRRVCRLVVYLDPARSVPGERGR